MTNSHPEKFGLSRLNPIAWIPEDDLVTSLILVFLPFFGVETPTLSRRSPSRGSGVKTFVHTSVNVVAKLQGTIAQAG